MKFIIFSSGIKRKALTARCVNWFIVISYMALIFIFSSQVASQSEALSMGIVNKVMATPVKDTLTRGQTDLIVRKTAHFAEYCLLAFLIYRAFLVCRVRHAASAALTMLVCILYAVSDEYHQSFVQGRGPRVLDVYIDTCGALMGVCMGYIRKKARDSSRQRLIKNQL